MLRKIRNSKLFIKYRHWEYWPTWLAYLPVLPIVLFYVAKTRRWFFFSNVNPLFKTGALMGASKNKILSLIPDRYKPKTIYIAKEENDLGSVLTKIDKAGITFPLIVKPDVGERGLLVALLQNKEELLAYINANRIDFLVQEYISLPNECGIFYVRLPSEEYGRVVSVGLKDFLRLEGDGRSTVRDLMQEYPRAKMQIERFEDEGDSEILNKVLDKGELLMLEPIGNHSRGTIFKDGNHLISDKLNETFNEINKHMDQVYYGRFDVKYDCWEKLLKGEDLKILEMNGIASEPIHIYDESVRIQDKYKSFYDLWKTIYKISLIQKSRGVQPISLKAAYIAFKEYKEHINSLNTNWKSSVQNLGVG